MPNEPCYICEMSSNIVKHTYEAERTEDRVLVGEYYEVVCPRCDKYKVCSRNPRSLVGELGKQQKANISYWIRHNQTSSESPIIDAENIDSLRNLRTPTVGDKAERFIIYFITLNPIPGTYIKRNVDAPDFLSEIGFTNLEEVEFVVNQYLRDEKKYIDGSFHRDKNVGFRITPAGWAYIESLKDINPESQIGFVAMWFDESLRRVYEEAIMIAIRDAGYEPLRIDYKEHNNRIDDEIIATIKRSRFLVADFTGQREGVYFEAGYALGLGLEVIWLCKKEELDDNKIHFDTRQYNFITWEEEKLDDLINGLRFRIERTIGRGNYKVAE